MDAPRYYMPYESDKEYDKKTDYDTDTDGQTTDNESTDYEDERIRREEDPRYAMLRTAGPNFPNFNSQLNYQYGQLTGSNYLINTNVNSLGNSLFYTNPSKVTRVTLLSMKSSNRDTSVYPTDSYFTLKTPRVYKNVTKFELVQMNFPNFPQAIVDISGLISTVNGLIPASTASSCLSPCFNAYFGYTPFVGMGVYEEGRVNEFGKYMYLAKGVTPNIYNTNLNSQTDLATEMNKQFNNTPTFNLITFNDFNTNFSLTGDLTYLFNKPGGYWGTSLTNGILNTTDISTVASYYFPLSSINTTNLSTSSIFVAYYYPVMKDMLATKKALPLLYTFNSTIEQVCDLFVCNFLGLDSPIYYAYLSSNINVLTEYRNLNTYLLQPVNNYEWSFNTRLKQYRVYHNRLSITLQNEINNMYSNYKNEIINNYAPFFSTYGISSFSGLVYKNTINNAVFQSYLSLVSTQLFSTYGIQNFYYPVSTLANSTFNVVMTSTLSSINPNTTYMQLNYNLSGNNLSSMIFNLLDNTYAVLSTLSTVNINENVSTATGFYPSSSTLIGAINLPNIQYGGTYVNLASFFSTNYNMQSTYTSYISTNQLISTINSQTASSLYQYMSSKYSQVFPSTYLGYQTYLTGEGLPVTFVTNRYWYVSGAPILDSESNSCDSICRQVVNTYISGYYSDVQGYTINNLSYKLGLYNPSGISDTSLISTVGAYNAYSNFNLLLQINTFQSFNNIDITMNENYKITNETTGQANLISCKILTAGNDPDQYTQTVIKNPVVFPGTLGKLDKLTFQILIEDPTLTRLDTFFPFSYPFTHWDAIFSIEEEVANTDRNGDFSMIPTVQMPNNIKPI